MSFIARKGSASSLFSIVAGGVGGREGSVSGFGLGGGAGDSAFGLGSPGSLHPTREGGALKSKRFACGDSYAGGWRLDRPDGEGRYTWADGSYYDGQWRDGMRHGVGRYVWPSGASYQGEWREGYMHGTGTLDGPPGTPGAHAGLGAAGVTSRYQGGWQRDQKHGLGKQLWGNGDLYEGLWQGGLPDGPGRYIFSNRDEFDGEWRGGLMAGQGTWVWHTGERYEGQWKDGHQEGLGTLTLPSGALFEGQWQNGRRHGVCIYRPPPSEVIALPPGAVAAGAVAAAAAGVGGFVSRRRLSVGPTASGASTTTVQGGSALLRGGSKELKGDDKLTQQQQLDGSIFARPSAGPSMWDTAELMQPGMHGGQQGGSHPPSPVLGVTTRMDSGSDIAGGAGGASVVSRSGPLPTLMGTGSHITLHHPSHGVTSAELAPTGHSNSRLGSLGAAAFTAAAYVRIYDHGVVTQEWPMSKEDGDSIMAMLGRTRQDSTIGRLLRKGGSSVGGAPGAAGEPGSTDAGTTGTTAAPGSSSTGASGTEKKGGSSKRMGEAIHKGHASYDLMLCLQLGLRYSIVQINSDPSPRELSPPDFQLKVKQFFPRAGSEVTPVHAAEDFGWKDYAPLVFRKLRELYAIDAADYMLSLCSDAALRQLNSPGKSGSVFFLSHDDRFFVKTLKKGEVRLLQSMLPYYYRHMAHYPHALLTKFFGLHQITTANGRKVHIVVMANLFHTNVQLHRKFDLKGSRLGRTAGPDAEHDPLAILKDLDLDVSFRLEEGWLERLVEQLKADCALLESCHIMDYSLLVGINYRSRGGLPGEGGPRVQNFAERAADADYHLAFPRLAEKVAKARLPSDARDALLGLVRARLGSTPDAVAAARARATGSTGGPNHPGGLKRMGTMTHWRLAGAGTGASSSSPHLTKADSLALQLGLSHVVLGVNMPAVAVPHSPAAGMGPEDVVLYFGVIDFLQDYNPQKRLEHGLKSLLHDSYSISVTHPKTYSQRFQSFLKSVFV